MCAWVSVLCINHVCLGLVLCIHHVCLCLVAYVLAAQVDFGHALRGRDQEPDEELLSGHVDVWGDLAAWADGRRSHIST